MARNRALISIEFFPHNISLTWNLFINICKEKNCLAEILLTMQRSLFSRPVSSICSSKRFIIFNIKYGILNSICGDNIWATYGSFFQLSLKKSFLWCSILGIYTYMNSNKQNASMAIHGRQPSVNRNIRFFRFHDMIVADESD